MDHSAKESKSTGASDVHCDKHGHAHGYTFVIKGPEKSFKTGPTLYTDMLFDASGKDAKVKTTKPDGINVLTTDVKHLGEDTTAID